VVWPCFVPKEKLGTPPQPSIPDLLARRAGRECGVVSPALEYREAPCAFQHLGYPDTMGLRALDRLCNSTSSFDIVACIRQPVDIVGVSIGVGSDNGL
jgi:hypothetical protein